MNAWVATLATWCRSLASTKATTFPRATDNDNRIGHMLHNACSAERMLALNDVERQKLLMHAMRTVVQRLTSSIRRQPAAKSPSQTTVLDASDGSLLALLFCAACDHDKQIQVLFPNFAR